MLILSDKLIKLCIIIVTVVCTVYLKEISHCLNPCLATKFLEAHLSHLICDIVTPNRSSSTEHASEVFMADWRLSIALLMRRRAKLSRFRWCGSASLPARSWLCLGSSIVYLHPAPSSLSSAETQVKRARHLHLVILEVLCRFESPVALYNRLQPQRN